MPLYVIDSNSLEQRLAIERSPEVVLLTNAKSLDAVPSAIREVADRPTVAATITPEIFRGARSATGTILWLEGESLAEGAPEAIRRGLRHFGRTTFVTVHFPCIAHADLLGLQPRLFGPGESCEESIDSTIRIRLNATRERPIPELFRRMRGPWARLSYALYRDQSEPGAALPELGRLRREEKLTPILDALALRNLAVLHMRDGRPEQARTLLQQGQRKYPDYAELSYLEALFAMQGGDGERAIALLNETVRKPRGTFAGSGGETSHRAHWLVGMMGDLTGNQSIACGHYYTGVCALPAFEPSVIGLLKQRLPASVVDSMQWELCHLVRREPRYLEPIFYFLLVHRAFSAARRLIDTLEMSETQRAALLKKFHPVFSSYQKRPENSAEPTGVLLTGPFLMNSSIARINREIAGALMGRTDFKIGLEPHGFALLLAANTPNGNAIANALYRRPPHLDLTIRHHWPHDFSQPTGGKLAVIVPWEFGAVPRAWVQQIEKNVDELWVPSKFVKDVFVRCGVRPEQVAIVPNGVNTNLFRPDGNAWRPPEASGFIFLFVGGAIERKGVDVLVKAYQSAFTPQDNVTLIIKDIGSTTFYRHMTLVPRLKEEANRPQSPRLLVLTDELDEARLAELYRGCDAFVLPYRGEGFGMPLVEAMACGKPVITTAEGPASEFCPADCAYFIPAETVPIPGGIGGFGELVAEPTWFEPDVDELSGLMRWVYENRTEAAARGARAAERIRPILSWERVTRLYIERVAALTNREVRLAASALHTFD